MFVVSKALTIASFESIFFKKLEFRQGKCPLPGTLNLSLYYANTVPSILNFSRAD